MRDEEVKEGGSAAAAAAALTPLLRGGGGQRIWGGRLGVPPLKRLGLSALESLPESHLELRAGDNLHAAL